MPESGARSVGCTQSIKYPLPAYGSDREDDGFEKLQEVVLMHTLYEVSTGQLDMVILTEKTIDASSLKR